MSILDLDSIERKDTSVCPAITVPTASEASPHDVLIISDYQLVEKPSDGVFC